MTVWDSEIGRAVRLEAACAALAGAGVCARCGSPDWLCLGVSYSFLGWRALTTPLGSTPLGSQQALVAGSLLRLAGLAPYEVGLDDWRWSVVGRLGGNERCWRDPSAIIGLV